jgi:hypothetical protein
MPNAFDFHSEVAEEEVAKKAADEAKIKEETEMIKKKVSIGGNVSSKETQIKSGGGLFSAGGGATSKVNMSKKEAQEKILADKKAKKFAKLFGEEPEPKMKVLTLEMMESKRKNAAKKKREDRRAAVLESLKDKGKDDGKGAQKLLTSYVDEVLAIERPFTSNKIPEHLSEKKSWQDCTFFEKLTRSELKEIPLVSQVVTQKALVPIHNDLKKKQFNDICKRLRRNDGSLVRLRLNGGGVSDNVASQLSLALEKNLYAQHLMLHDNRVTDVGVESLCGALRWHPGVHTVWLGGNPITDRGCKALANLAHVNHNIKDLNISNKKPGQTWSGEPNIYDTCITHQGADALARSLMRSCQITSLNLADQRIRDQGANLLFSSLRKSFLRTLNLKNNALTDKCCVMLRDVLIYESAGDDYSMKNINNDKFDFTNGNGSGGLKLEKLILAENKIGNNGASNIAYALCYNKMLQALDLSYNEIGDEGINELLSCLQFNQVLRSVYTIYNTTDDERVDRILEMRTAAMEALESHIDRADLREKFHNTGLVIDRTGQVSLNSAAAKKRGRINTPGAGNAISPGQLADSMNSRGELGFDLDVDGSDNEYNSDESFSDYDPNGDRPSTYGSRAGTADAGYYDQDVDLFERNVGSAHRVVHEDIRVRPVPSFLPVTTNVLKKLAKQSKYAAKDNRHLLKTPTSPSSSRGGSPNGRQLTAGSISTAGSIDGFGGTGGPLSAGGSNSQDQGYMLHDGNKYGDNFVDLENSIDGDSSLLEEKSTEKTIGSNLSTGQTGRHLKLERPSTSGSMIDTINKGRHATDLALDQTIDILRANVDNPKIMMGVKGVAQKPIDWSQVAVPAHLISIARLASDGGNHVQNFNVKERRDLYKALGNFVPRSARRPPTKSGGGRAGSAVKPPSTAPAGSNRQSGRVDVGVSEEKKEDSTDGSVVSLKSAGSETNTGSLSPLKRSSVVNDSGTDTISVNDVTAGTVTFGSAVVVDQFPPNPNSSRSSRTGSPERGRSPQRGVSSDRSPSPHRTQSPPKSAMRKNGQPTAESGMGERLSTPGYVIGENDGGVDIRLTLSVQEQHANALSRASSANEAYKEAITVKPGNRGPTEAELKKQAEILKFKPKMPLGRVGSAGTNYGMSGRQSPARPFRNYEEGNSLTDIFFRTKRGGNTHETVENSVYFLQSNAQVRPKSMGVADFKSEMGDLMWNKAINSVGLSTAETRESRDSQESTFASSRHTRGSGVHTAPAPGERIQHTKYDDEEDNHGNDNYNTNANGTGERKLALENPSEDQCEQERPSSLSPPRSPNRARSRMGTAPSMAPINEGDDVNSPPGSREFPTASNSTFSPIATSASDLRIDLNRNSHDDDASMDSNSTRDTEDVNALGMVVPPGRSTGFGGDMGTFFSLFQDPNDTSSSDEDSDSDVTHDTGASFESIEGVLGEQIVDDEITIGIKARFTDFESAQQARKQKKKEKKLEKSEKKRRKKEIADKNNSNTPLKAKGAAESSIMTTEELEAIQQASITDKMRLGAHLPNSSYKRLFDKTGKPILSKDLGKTRGVPAIPSMGIRPIRSVTSTHRDSGKHLTYLRIATPDDPHEQRPISLMEIAKTQKEHVDKIRAERQTEVYKELKKDAFERIPRKKQRAAAYPVPDKFWEAWRRDNRLRYPNGIDRARGTSSTDVRSLSKLQKNADGTVRMDALARERLLVKTPGQALVFRRKQAKLAELERQKHHFFDMNQPSIGKAKKLTHDLLGLRDDQSTTDLLDKRSGLTKKTGTMEATPMASMEMRKPGAFKAPTLGG